ncbi:MAG: serine protease [Bradymonadales bacterium]|nr:MAG: serine protease [Bradymonadales bacterium]
MVLRKALVLGLLVSLYACERTPDWEAQKLLREQDATERALESVESFLWSCRGKLERPIDQEHPFFGKLLSDYIESYKRSGLQILSDASEKSWLGTAFYWEELEVFLIASPFVATARSLECRQEASRDWERVELIGQDDALGFSLLARSSESRPSHRFGQSFNTSSLPIGVDLYALTRPYPGLVLRQKVLAGSLREPLHTGIDSLLVLVRPSLPVFYWGGVLSLPNGQIQAWIAPKNSELWGTAISFSKLSVAVRRILNTGSADRAYLGLRLQFEEEEGFVVQEIALGGLAQEAGLQVGDEILVWNGKTLESYLDWPELWSMQEQEALHLTYRRDGKDYETRLRLSR